MATVDSSNQGVKPKKSSKSSTYDANTGKDSLKIPLNTGSTSTTKQDALNMGI